MPKAKITYTGGMQFVAQADSGPAIVMDADKEFGGNNAGPRPSELLIMGIGGCSGMDIISVLRKKKENVTGLEINVNGTKAEEHPKKYVAIDVEYIVKGKNLSDAAVKRAVDLSMEKYCSVKATLEGTAKITYTYRIVEE
jgi:putative redox protein